MKKTVILGIIWSLVISVFLAAVIAFTEDFVEQKHVKFKMYVNDTIVSDSKIKIIRSYSLTDEVYYLNDGTTIKFSEVDSLKHIK